MTDWKERLNKQFFGGIPIELMGTNQVDELKLQAFIETELARVREEATEEERERIYDLYNLED